MDYILLTPHVRSSLMGYLEAYQEEVGRELELQEFLNNIFNKRGRGILYTKTASVPIRLKLWSPNVVLTVEEVPEQKAFCTVNVKEGSWEKYSEILQYCHILTGEWEFRLVSESIEGDGQYKKLTQEVVHYERKKELDRYEQYWMNFDIITQKQEEKSKEKEKWSVTPYHGLKINFDLNRIILQLSEEGYRFAKGDRVALYRKQQNTIERFSVQAEVVEYREKQKQLEIVVSDAHILNQIHKDKGIYSGHVVLNDIGTRKMLQRQKQALKKLFLRDTANERLKDFMPNIANAGILREDELQRQEDEQLPDWLTDVQKRAIRGAYQSEDIYLIQGPPGTGKTTVICEIIKRIHENGQTVLISSQSHLAVDNVLQRIGDEPGVRAIRIGDEDKIELGCNKYLLTNRVQDMQEKLLNKLMNFGEMKETLYDRYSQLEEVIGAYHREKEKFKLLNNLILNYKQQFKDVEKINERYEEYLKKEKNLLNKVESFPKEIIENSELLLQMKVVLDKYEGTSEMSLQHIEAILNTEFSKEEMECVEAYGILLQIVETEVTRYREVQQEKVQLQQELSEVVKSFSSTKQEVLSLSSQLEEASAGIQKIILEDIEELKDVLRELKLSHTRLQSKINGRDRKMQEIYEQIQEAKNQITCYGNKMEDMIIKYSIFDFSKQGLIESLKMKRYLSSNPVFTEYGNLLPYMESYDEIERISLELKEVRTDVSSAEKERGQLTKKLNQYEMRITEYEQMENIKKVIAYLQCSLMEFTKEHIVLLDQIDEEYEALAQKKELLAKTEDLRQDLMEDLQEYHSGLEDMYIEVSNLVCATCSGIAGTKNNYFVEKTFDYVIVDEAAKCLSSELLIPMIKGRKIILVGDHKQISPKIDRDILEELEKEAKIAGDDKSLDYNNSLFGITFEQASDTLKCTLNQQHRMHMDISAFISKQFYKGILQDGSNIMNRNHGIKGLRGGMYWIDTGRQDSGAEVTVHNEGRPTFYNHIETKIIIDTLLWLDKNLKHSKSVGVISPYKGQKDYLTEQLATYEFHNIDLEINTIDAYQGREKQIIIMNLVRNNPEGILGHTSENARVNVALSRAQELVLVIGDGAFIMEHQSKSRALYPLWEYVKKNHMVVQGNLMHAVK